MKAALAGEKCKVEGFISGLGGRDIDTTRLEKVFDTLKKGEKGFWLK